ncbi:hypothetical protein [Mycobacterium kansasii]|nr:hypothetical protein [Mycobacterium kansasii]
MNVFMTSPDPVPDWLQILAAAGTALGSLGVIAALITVAISWVRGREQRQQSAQQAVIDRERHEAQLAAFRQAEDDRLAAQARRVIPSIIPASFVTPGASPSVWNIQIANWSNDAISRLQVEIDVLDTNGEKVFGGYRLADRVSLGESMMTFFMPEFAKVIDGAKYKFQEFVDAIRNGVISLGEPTPQDWDGYFNNMKLEIDQQTAAILQQQVNYALTVNLTDEWPDSIAPTRYVAMAIQTTKPEYRLRVKIRYEDASGYRWERSDTEGPKRIHESSSDN